MSTRPLGFILQESRSPIDGSPIVVILTLNSSNRKTGPMAQVWILRADINPVEALKLGHDVRSAATAHTANKLTAPALVTSTWPAVRLEGLPGWQYQSISTAWLPSRRQGRKVRWGAYGDPALVDPLIFRVINHAADGHTGYTHQWREPFAQWATGHLQAIATAWPTTGSITPRMEDIRRDPQSAKAYGGSSAPQQRKAAKPNASPARSVTVRNKTSTWRPMAAAPST